MTAQDDMERLQEAWRDLAYVFARELGIIRLVERLGMKPKRWVRERQARDEWKKK